MKKIIIISILLIFSIMILVFAKEFITFTNNRQDGNLTYLGDENKTLYVTIPADSNITNFTLTLEGLRGPLVERLNITNVTNMIGNFSNSFCSGNNDTYIYLKRELCYQETANESTPCGGLSTGNYSFINVTGYLIDEGKFYDEDYSTYGYCKDTEEDGVCYIYINYSKPNNPLNTSIWQVKRGTIGTPIYANYTLPSGCWLQSPLQFRIYEYDKYYIFGIATITTNLTCFDGGDWHQLYYHSGEVGQFIYEEAMYWDYSSLGNYSLNNSAFAVGTNYTSNDSIYLEFYGEEEGCELDLDEGDYLEVYYNDGEQINITFPDIILSATGGPYTIGLYPTTDGSTFYDREMTNFSALSLIPLGNYSEGYTLSLGNHADGHIDRDYNDTFDGINETDLIEITETYLSTQSNNVTIPLLINSNTTGTIRYYLENLTYYTFPTVSNVTLFPRPVLATQSLNCTYNFDNNDSLLEQSRTFYWFVNDELNYTTNSFVNFSNNNFSGGDQIICGVKASHEFGESIVINSSQITVGDNQTPYYLDISYTSSLLTTDTQTVKVDVADDSSNMDFARLSYTSPTGTNSNVSMTKVNNTQFNLSFSTLSAGTWTIDEVYYADSSGNTNDTVLSESFTVTAPEVGGGGGAPDLSELGESCTDNSDCLSLLCDTMVTETCVENLCGNGYCDETTGENINNCAQDCGVLTRLDWSEATFVKWTAFAFIALTLILMANPDVWGKMKRKFIIGGKKRK